jgi:glutathione synthase/RimK-type ligase-like ATP-grasp enzyme
VGRVSLRLLLLTPAPDEPRFAAIAHQWADRLAGALATQDIAVETRPWTAAEDLYGFNGVSPLLSWSYHQHLDAWHVRLATLGASGLPVVNAAETVRWNTRKTYLAELETAGVPIVPTLFADVLTAEVVREAHDRFGPSVVAKPQVSGGSFATVRLEQGHALRDGPPGPAMVQPFLKSIAGEGELSLLYFDGVFSHAIGKRAQAGDFRVQYQYGGTYAPIDPPAEAFAVAEAVLAAAGRSLTYARIDLIRADDGSLRLMEPEAIEPDLYLEHAPDSGAAFAKAMRRALEE